MLQEQEATLAALNQATLVVCVTFSQQFFVLQLFEFALDRHEHPQFVIIGFRILQTGVLVL